MTAAGRAGPARRATCAEAERLLAEALARTAEEAPAVRRSSGRSAGVTRAPRRARRRRGDGDRDRRGCTDAVCAGRGRRDMPVMAHGRRSRRPRSELRAASRSGRPRLGSARRCRAARHRATAAARQERRLRASSARRSALTELRPQSYADDAALAARGGPGRSCAQRRGPGLRALAPVGAHRQRREDRQDAAPPQSVRPGDRSGHRAADQQPADGVDQVGRPG